MLRGVLSKVAATVLVAGIFGFLGWRLWGDREVLQQVAWWAHPGLLMAHLVLLVITFGCLVLGWVRILGICGGVLPASASASTWLMSNLGKYIPGKVLMLAGRVELARKWGVRRAIAMSALAIEHVVLLVAAVPFLLWSLSRGFGLGSDLAWPTLVAAALVATVFVMRPSLLVALVNLLLRATSRTPLSAAPRARDTATLLGLYFVGWLAYGASGVLLLEALELGADIHFVDGVAAFVAAWMVGFLSLITPGGIGVREGALVVFLGSTVPAPEAITVALVARLSWTLVEIGGVLLGLMRKVRPT
jgi:uncharacterized membrane protein YbhN (UPF0104 family)